MLQNSGDHSGDLKRGSSDALCNSVAIKDSIIGTDDAILVTGAAGFIGSRVVQNLLGRGFTDLRCFVRHSSDLTRLRKIIDDYAQVAHVEIMTGNLLSREDCLNATRGIAVIYHLAAGTGTKSFSDAYMNSVVTTRNLLDAALQNKCLHRIVNLSSFAVYAGGNKPRRAVLDESCPMEDQPERRAEAYCYAKVKQDELVIDYGRNHGIPYVMLRPGVVYGPGKCSITGRVGIDTFGVFLHFGGSNSIPLTYVENCAEAIVLAGLAPGVDGEAFNIVDDDLPSSRDFLRQYKTSVRMFRSIYVPHWMSYLFCWLWEKYSTWSEGQLPPVFTRKEWFSYWKKTAYSNKKLKRSLEWSPKVTTAEGLRLFFKYCREQHARA
jgi:2-alkyl-3-oxoalkanoate reductase